MTEPEMMVRSDRVYSGRIVQLRVDEVRLPDGRSAQREVVEHPGSVAVVALDADGAVVLVRQYRYPAGRALLEIPAGTRKPGENPLVCVTRELTEETGYTAGRIEHLIGFYVAPGFCTEYLDVYLATDLVPGVASPDEDEGIEVVRMPLDEAVARVDHGEICDGKSVIGLLVVARRMAAAAGR